VSGAHGFRMVGARASDASPSAASSRGTLGCDRGPRSDPRIGTALHTEVRSVPAGAGKRFFSEQCNLPPTLIHASNLPMTRHPTNLPRSQAFHLGLVVSVALLVWAWWPAWCDLLEIWQSDPDYNHGFLVLPIAGWLLWQRRDLLRTIEWSPSWWGLVPIAVAAGIRFLGADFFIEQFDPWSIPIWVGGTVLLLGGWSLLRWSAGAIMFLWFMTPIPSSLIAGLTFPLQKISAAISTWTLQLMLQPAILQGTTISIGEHILEVERACSGLRICYGILALAVAYVLLKRTGWILSGLLILAAVPVALLANSTRVTATGLLITVMDSETANQYVHDFAGILMLPLAAAMFWLTQWCLNCVIVARSTLQALEVVCSC
jgi:exosortase